MSVEMSANKLAKTSRKVFLESPAKYRRIAEWAMSNSTFGRKPEEARSLPEETRSGRMTSVRKPDLLHVRLVVPEQVLLVHHAVLPVAERGHPELEGLARRGEGLAVADRHGLREGALHHADDAGPVARAELDRMHLDARVGRVDEHRFQVLDVLLDAPGLMAVGPMDDDVLRVALVQAGPFLGGEDGAVELGAGGRFAGDGRLPGTGRPALGPR